jgi:hypothetical protein
MNRDWVAVQASGTRMRRSRRSFNVRKRDQNHTPDASGYRRVNQVGEPAGVGFGKERGRPRSEQNPGKMHDTVGAPQGTGQGLGPGEVGLDDIDAGLAGQILRYRRAVAHQTQIDGLLRQPARQTAPQITGGASD